MYEEALSYHRTLLIPHTSSGRAGNALTAFLFAALFGAITLTNIFINLVGSVYDNETDRAQGEWEDEINLL